MEHELQLLCSKLNRGPAFLFLGQDYLGLESGQDTFLSEVAKKYGHVEIDRLSYHALYTGNAQRHPEAALAWMQKRCERIFVPDWVRRVADFPWCGVYTSAIDTVWLRAFRQDWREIQPIFEEKYRPADPRNRTKLHCTFLFGCVDRVEEYERTPLTKLQYLKRKQVAVSLLRRLPEVMTPFGVIALEGYAGIFDWLSPDDLLPVIDEFTPGQVHVFSTKKEFAENLFVSELEHDGKLVLHFESLSEVLLKGEEAGFLKPAKFIHEEDYGHRIQIGDYVYPIPTQVWNQIARSATVLYDSILAAPAKVSKEKKYQEFRTFLGDSALKPVWTGYARHFAFPREFERKLHRIVEGALKSARLRDEPIILHGSTGTGKTIALGALAYKIGKAGKFPVLFIERKAQKPLASDIDMFCKWAEDKGSIAILVIWDGMTELDQYYEFLHYLVGRGRKVTLLGSCYRLDASKLKRTALVEAPAELNRAEVVGFRSFLGKIDPSLIQVIGSQTVRLDETFLSALYRLLPASRPQIRMGIDREVGSAEKKIKDKLQEIVPDHDSNLLKNALLKAGYFPSEKLMLSQTVEYGNDQIDKVQELIGIVMVPGQFGLWLPIELLMHTITRNGLLSFNEILSGVDIFRWLEDGVGNISIAPRTALEAKLLVQARFGGPQTEMQFARRLLIEIRDDSQSFSEGIEIQFAIDLVKNMGPNGPYGNYFAPYFTLLSETLQELRDKRGVHNTRLMLQEAMLLRESVAYHARQGCPPSNAEQLLDKAESVLVQALQQAEEQNYNPRFRGAIVVELASTLGTKVKHIIDCSERPQDSLKFFKEARARIFEANSIDPDSSYPTDVLGWTTRDLLKAKILDEQTRSELQADVFHMFSLAQSAELGTAQRERIERRRMEIGDLLSKDDISEDAFQRLVEMGSSAGYFLRAFNMVRDLPVNAELSPDEQASCHRAVDYLEENHKKFLEDSRCLYLLLRLWWMSKTGKPIFWGERQTLPFDKKHWSYAHNIILELLNTQDFHTNPKLRYLYGLSCFHLGFTEDCFQAFRELERDSMHTGGKRRVIRSHLASTPHGAPMVFNGTVSWLNNDKTKGELYVPYIRKSVTFLLMDFNRPEIQQGDGLDFHIAFNFIGAIADPIK